MSQWRDCLAPIMGRILIGGFFLWSGIFNAINFGSTLKTLQHVTFLHVLLPFFTAIAIVVIQICAGVALVLGWRTRGAAFILALYMLAATLLLSGNAFNTSDGSLALLKDFAIIGGLLYMSAYGSGRWGLKRD